jgi:hypothetical protein
MFMQNQMGMEKSFTQSMLMVAAMMARAERKFIHT